MTLIIKSKPQTPEDSGSAVSTENPESKSAPPGSSAGFQKIRNDLNPAIKIETLAVSDIKYSKQVVRKTGKRKVGKLKKSFEEFGFRIPLIVDKNYTLIDGHARLEAALQLGLENLPCIVIDDLSETEIRTIRLVLNRIPEDSEWDTSVLRAELLFLLDEGVELASTGFEVAETDKIILLDDHSASSDTSHPADNVLQKPPTGTAIVTQTGDIWELGPHRILCGNARRTSDITLLIHGQTISAIFADPPYNVPISGHVCTDAGKHPEFAEASGEMTPTEFRTFLEKSLSTMTGPLKPGGIAFVCMDWRHLADLISVVNNLGLELVNMCVWAKDKPGMGSLYRSQHELVLVIRKQGAGHMNNVQLGKYGRNRSNVWQYAGATGGKSSGLDDFSVHPTVKPINLVRDALLDVTALGDVVLDPFLGSGSTLLAAEVSKRICFGVEISAAYVDVSIRRWEDLTGLKATHAKSGLTFEQLSSARGCDIPEDDAAAAAIATEDF